MDTALQCLVLVARHHGMDLSVERLKHEHAITENEVADEVLLRVGAEAGLEVRSAKMNWTALAAARHSYPLIARLKNGFSVVLVGVRRGAEGEEMLVLDPMSAQAELLPVSRARFEERYGGQVLMTRSTKKRAEGEQPFGMGWFAAEIMRNRTLFAQVMAIALLLHVLAFVPAFFAMTVFDRVVTFQVEDTLHVLFAGVVLALGFNAVLGYLRSLLLLYATGRLEIRAADFSFSRLLGLPLGYFQTSSAGTLVKHLQQTSHIREFFTGSLMLTLIELTSLLILIPVLGFFSFPLTLVVLGFAALIGLNVLITTRPYRRSLQRLYNVEGEKQSVLVETINGMETVKTLALEPTQQRRWLDFSAQTVRLQFNVGRWSALTSEASGLLMKLMSAVVIWAGTLLLFQGKISMGALIAFNMLAMRATGPLVQLVSLVNKYQQAALSLRMLAGVLNRPAERARSAGISAEVEGAVEFDRVSFRYAADGANVLDGVSVSIDAGQRIGLVGRSGCGKSTLVRLLQGMFSATSGVIRIDGRDLREYDLLHLRTSVAVVVQRSFLFKGTVRDNIAKARPSASLEDVIEAAKMAGAAQFIESLPKSYDTPLEEDAANLSGGQKQRLALARALLQRPRILILDEATSALDAESEAAVRANFPIFSAGRTVINISHRLSLLTDMDAILVLDEGRVVDFAPHTTLLQRCALYRTLWFTQNPHLASNGAGR